MATPLGDEYVELVGTGSTLLLGSAAIRLRDAADVMSVGPSRGSDLTVGGASGALARARRRDPLSVSLGVMVVGLRDEDGVLVADPVANALTLVDKIVGFVEDEGREFTMKLTQYGDAREADARFEEFGGWERPAPDVWKVSMLVTVPAGRLALVVP